MSNAKIVSVSKESDYAKDTLRVCSEANQGMRKYMEDELTFSLDEKDNRRAAFFGIFDGHGGKDASIFAKEHLYENIKAHQGFNSNDPEQIKDAIKHGFKTTHLAMKNDIENWPKRKDGHYSTSGTTVTIAIVRNNKLFVAHVGDSAAVLAKKYNNIMVTEELTIDHKPDNTEEKSRIQSLGGRVAVTNGVPRVVWKRQVRNASPQLGQSTLKFEYVPFLAVSRALGDLWSYDQERQKYIVSPEPDIKEIDIIPGKTKFLILASDGLWGVMKAKEAVDAVYKFEVASKLDATKRNSSDHLIKTSLSLWQKKRSRADNISAIVVFFDQEYCENDVESELHDATEEEIDSCAETDIISGNEDDTPPMVKSITNGPLVRQPAFHNEKELAEKLKFDVNVTPNSDQIEAFKNENCCLSKRKNTEFLSLNNQKKLKTSSPVINPPIVLDASPLNSTTSTEDSHQCKVITVLSTETLYDLQLDEDLGFADDESDIDKIEHPKNLHSEISKSSFNKAIPVGKVSK